MQILYLSGQLTDTVFLEHDDWIIFKLRDPATKPKEPDELKIKRGRGRPRKEKP